MAILGPRYHNLTLNKHLRDRKSSSMPLQLQEVVDVSVKYAVQPADIGWPTGNRKKLSSTQAQLGQATCLAVA